MAATACACCLRPPPDGVRLTCWSPPFVLDGVEQRGGVCLVDASFPNWGAMIWASDGEEFDGGGVNNAGQQVRYAVQLALEYRAGRLARAEKRIRLADGAWGPWAPQVWAGLQKWWVDRAA